MKKICILGTRTTSEEYADIAMECGYDVLYFVENMFPEKVGNELHGIPIVWYTQIAEIEEEFEVICGIASSHQRKLYVQNISEFIPDLKWATIIHPSASVSRSVVVEEGTLISRGVTIGSHTKIGKHCFLNRSSAVGHHDILSDFVTVSPGAVIAGACNIGVGSYISVHASIIDHTTVGDNSFVAAGAVVINDIPSNVAVMGIPAKPKILQDGSRALERIDSSKYQL